MNVNAKDIVEVGKNLYDNNLVSGKAGNISVRIKRDDGDIIAITPTFSSLGSLKEEDIVLIDFDGNCLTKGKPSSEYSLHLEIYKKRDDVNAIVHTHSPYATGFAFSSKKIKRHEGFGQIVTPFLEEVEYAKPGSMDLAKSAAGSIGSEDVLVLKHHGILAVGDNLKEAYLLAAFIEDTAKTQYISYMLNLVEDL